MVELGLEGEKVMRRLILAAILMISSPAADAATCEQFRARFLEGAAYYKVPAPKFDLVHVNEADANIRYWSITTFGDVRAEMSCRHGGRYLCGGCQR
jgi:hypothetical protein